MSITDAGENRAWGLLAAGDPAGVCARAAVDFDAASGAYRVPSFGRRFSVSPGERLIRGLAPEDQEFLGSRAALLRLSLLWYLVKAAPARPAGTLVRPSSLPGGEIFCRGTHVLPLAALAARYATRPEAFLAAGAGVGGAPAAFGDAAVVLSPLPKVPATVLLWTADDEFPARADLLFDATCSAHLPVDILWAVAMLSVQSLAEATPGGFPFLASSGER